MKKSDVMISLKRYRPSRRRFASTLFPTVAAGTIFGTGCAARGALRLKACGIVPAG